LSGTLHFSPSAAEPGSDPQGKNERPRAIKTIRPPSFSPLRLLGAVAQLFEYRDLILTLSIHRLKVRYNQSVLGWAWAVLQPLSLMLIYTVIFSVVTKIPSDKVPYALFVYTALLPWTYFSTIVTTAATSLVRHTQLITKVYFPREILPITYIVIGLFDFLVAVVLLGMMMLYYRVHPTWNALYLLPIWLIVTALGTALALVFSALEVRFRDIGLAMPLLMQLWMFATPVVYPLSAVPERLRGYYILNPLVGVVENFRRVLIQNQGPDLVSLRTAAVVALIALPTAYLFFKQREASMADII
jgi:lipopolysaccharide transport system permease protein